jgi:hypothetical protein
MVSIVSPAEILSKNEVGKNLKNRQNGTITEIFSKISALVGNSLRNRIKKEFLSHLIASRRGRNQLYLMKMMTFLFLLILLKDFCAMKRVIVRFRALMFFI